MSIGELPHKITRWTTTPDGYGGVTFGTPIVLNGRWEDKNIQFRTPKGTEATSDAIVYLNNDVDLDDYLFLGDSDVADPTTLSGAKEVRKFNKTPDLRALDYERVAIL